VQQAADAPRFHHQYLPDALQVEKAFPLTVLDALKAMGYTVTPTNEAPTRPTRRTPASGATAR
jgi:gamma-glutamyltranspeptidase/glutathione hydrolase